jgi:hypothetical protein
MLCVFYSLALTALVLYQYVLGKGDNGFSIVTSSEDIIHSFGCPQVSTVRTATTMTRRLARVTHIHSFFFFLFLG